jgi:DNA-binding LacI/PurR family transcriptional regulator
MACCSCCRDGGAAVGATNRQGGYDATRYLLELGHRRIGFVTGTNVSYLRLSTAHRSALPKDPRSCIIEGLRRFITLPYVQ